MSSHFNIMVCVSSLFFMLGCVADHEASNVKETEGANAETNVTDNMDFDAGGSVKSMEYLILPQYDQTGPFFINGIMQVERKHGDKILKGFINDKGNIIIKPEYEDTKYYVGMSSGSSGVSEGLVPVKKNGKWGYVNTEGVVIINFKFNDAQLFIKDQAVVKVGEKYGLINKQGKMIVSPDFNQLYYKSGVGIVERNGKWGFIDKNGNWLTSPIYDDVDIHRNKESSNQIIVVTKGEFEGIVKINNEEVKVLITPKYTKIFPFKNGKAAFILLTKDKNGIYKEDKTFGYIDGNGNELFRWNDFKYDFGSLSEGLIAVQNKSSWGYMNLQKKIIIPYKFDSISPFEDGQALATLEGKVGIINNTGNWVLEPKYNNVVPMETYYLVESEQGKFLIDKMSLEKVSKIYDDIGRGALLKPMKSDEKVGFINTNGIESISPQYEECKYFSFWDGYALVKDKKGWFFINEEGEKLGNQTFEDATLFKGDYAGVMKNGKWGVINKRQELVLPCIFEEVTLYQNGIVKVLENEKYGFVKLSH